MFVSKQKASLLSLSGCHRQPHVSSSGRSGRSGGSGSSLTGADAGDGGPKAHDSHAQPPRPVEPHHDSHARGVQRGQQCAGREQAQRQQRVAAGAEEEQEEEVEVRPGRACGQEGRGGGSGGKRHGSSVSSSHQLLSEPGRLLRLCSPERPKAIAPSSAAPPRPRSAAIARRTAGRCRRGGREKGARQTEQRKARSSSTLRCCTLSCQRRRQARWMCFCVPAGRVRGRRYHEGRGGG